MNGNNIPDDLVLLTHYYKDKADLIFTQALIKGKIKAFGIDDYGSITQLRLGELQHIWQNKPTPIKFEKFPRFAPFNTLTIAYNGIQVSQQRADEFTENNIKNNEESEISDAEADLEYLNNPKDRDAILIEETKNILSRDNSITKDTLLNELFNYCINRKITITKERLSRIIHPEKLKKKMKSVKA